MKKIDWILITATGAYSFLFYEQSAGINFLLFNIIIIALLGIKDNTLLRNRNWQLSAAGCLLSSFCIALYGNSLSVISNIISLSILAGLSFNTNLSVILSLLFAFYSYGTSSFSALFNVMMENNSTNTDSELKNKMKKSWLILVPIFIVLLFFFMYKESNPLFDSFSKQINFDFISWNWIMFTLAGFIILFGFFNYKTIASLFNLDHNKSNDLVFNNQSEFSFMGKTINITDEYFSGKVLFISLNLLLLLVNILDFNFFFINRTLPEGVTYSSFVHQGTEMLIVSIIIAISIILFYFRGALNFYEKSKNIKIFVYIWIIQNAFMLVSTALRNDMYINDAGLTYKRIGVYVYLILTLIGLVTTFIKIAKTKSNNFLFRINGWLFYGVLLLSCFFNWDEMITNYNVRHTGNTDIHYLMGLSDSNLPPLFNLQQTPNLEQLIKNYGNHHNISYFVGETNDFEKALSRKLYYFLKNNEQLNWRSWNYENENIKNQLLWLSSYNKIKLIDFSFIGITSLNTIKNFTNIEELYLHSNEISDIKELSGFRNLKILDLEKNKLVSIKGIEKLKNLERLNLMDNKIYDYSPLYSLKNLKEIYLDTIISSYQYNLLKTNLPNTIIKLY